MAHRIMLMLSSEKACIKSSARASGWSLLKSNPFSEWGKKTGLSPKSLRRWRPKSTSCLTKFSPIMPLDKLTIPIVETISHPPRNRLSLFYHKRWEKTTRMRLRSSIESQESKQKSNRLSSCLFIILVTWWARACTSDIETFLEIEAKSEKGSSQDSQRQWSKDWIEVGW